MSRIRVKAKLSVGSQTNAQRARNELKSKGISSRIIKIESRLKDGGCLFGLELDELDLNSAQRVLHDSGIYTKQVI